MIRKVVLPYGRKVLVLSYELKKLDLGISEKNQIFEIRKKMKKIMAFFLITTVIIFMNLKIVKAVEPASRVYYEGIDVSNWQGDVNYEAVKSAGIEIVYIKTSEGATYKDPYFELNYEKAKANGLKVGFYHFLTATNTQNARNQAQFFASVISRKST